MAPACWLSFFTGFLSLGQEILWIRLFGFANHSIPQAFAFVLTVYLIGIAAGAEIGKRLCSRSRDVWKTSGLVLLASSGVDALAPWVYAEWSHTRGQLWIGGVLIGLTALGKAIIFPLAHHLGASGTGPRIGRSVSRVYVSNIAGATLGPLAVMGLLDLWTTQQVFGVFAVLVFSLGIWSLRAQWNPLRQVAAACIGLGVLALLWSQAPNALVTHAADTISQNGHKVEIRRIVENRHGIVVTYHGGEAGDFVWGGNVYDGRANLDLRINSNGLDRLVLLSALHDRPARVLMIGLSIGTWLKIVTAFPEVEQIDVIEINPGYLKVIPDYPAQLSALQDPRVHLYIDDGRRWLRTHPERQYDLIVMNNTFYWRVYSTLLLSREFLSMLKSHMRPHAILAYNSTWSPEAFETAAAVFPYAFARNNFVVAADFDWRKNYTPAMIPHLEEMTLDGKPLFPSGGREIIREWLREPVLSIDSMRRVARRNAGRVPEIVTDDNLITEFKYGRTLQ